MTGALAPWWTVRRIAVICWLNLKMIAVSAFDGVFQIIWPLYFAATALLVYSQSSQPGALGYAGLGASVMGMWSVVATTASLLLQRERWAGTLELLTTTPTRFATVLIGSTAAIASLGLVSLVTTYTVAWLVFGVAMPIARVGAFATAVIAALVSTSMLGFLLSVAVIRYRTAWALGNLLEYPGWLLCGFLVPLTVLPSWAQTISYALAPTWAMRALRAAAAGHSSWRPMLVCLAVGAAYGLVGLLLTETVLRSARRSATLSLS